MALSHGARTLRASSCAWRCQRHTSSVETKRACVLASGGSWPVRAVCLSTSSRPACAFADWSGKAYREASRIFALPGGPLRQWCRLVVEPCVSGGRKKGPQPAAAVIAIAAGIGGLAALAAGPGGGRSSPVCFDEGVSQDADGARLAAAVDEVIDDMINWASVPEEWWADRKTVKVRGLGEVSIRTKRAVSPLFGPAMLLVGIAIFEDTNMEEILYLTEAHSGCAKERFDPAIRKFEHVGTFPSPSGQDVNVLRSHTHPACMGLISAREVDSVNYSRLLEDGRLIVGGAGLHSPRIGRFCSGSPRLEAMRAAPPSKGAVRCVDHTSGFIHEPLDKEAASSGGRGRVRLWYFLCCEAGGGVPTWASEMGVSHTAVTFFTEASRELQLVKGRRAA